MIIRIRNDGHAAALLSRYFSIETDYYPARIHYLWFSEKKAYSSLKFKVSTLEPQILPACTLDHLKGHLKPVDPVVS